MTRAALRLALADLYAKLADVERRIRQYSRGPLRTCRPRAR
jgi:hypothetical protein